MKDHVGFSAAGGGERGIDGLASTDPLAVATTFLSLVLSGPAAADHLSRLITPESATAWGDFGAVRGRLAELGNWGLGTQAVGEGTTRDVAYVKILSDLSSAFRLRGDDVVSVAALITLVWRPEAQSWLVHAFGGYVPATRVPRTSPNAAPPDAHASH